jgi:hypothetical protein
MVPATAASATNRRRNSAAWQPLTQEFGFNTNNNYGPALTDPVLVGMMAGYSAGLFRFPGGGTANHWDWTVGDSTHPGNYHALWPLEDLKTFCDQTNSQPVYVLDLAWGTLADALDALDHAASVGLPVNYVELGNEYYLTGPNAMQFATVADYGTTASTWATAVRTHFPDARVAMVGWDRNKIFTTVDRQTTWNAGLRPFIEANPDISSITVHPYTFINYLQRLQDEILDLSPVNIQRLFATAFDARRDIEEVIAKDLPNDTTVWATEYNIVDSLHYVAAGRWIHAVWSATAAMQVAQVPRLEISIWHALTGAMAFAANHHPAYAENFRNAYGVDMVPWAPTACGVALNAVYTVLDGATHIAPLEFSEGGTIAVDVAGSQREFDTLVGLKTTGASRIQACVANLSSESVTVNLCDQGLPPSGHWVQYSAAPSMVITDGTTDVTTSDGPVCDHVVLAPYSLTTIGDA